MTHDSSSIAALLAPTAVGPNASGKASEAPLGASLGTADFSATWAALTAEDAAIVTHDAQIIEVAAEQQMETEGEESTPQDETETAFGDPEAISETGERGDAARISKALSPPDMVNRTELPAPPDEESDVAPKLEVSAPEARAISPAFDAPAQPPIPLGPTAEARSVTPEGEVFLASRSLERQAKTVETGLLQNISPENPISDVARMPVQISLSHTTRTSLAANKIELEAQHKIRAAEIFGALGSPETAAPPQPVSAPSLQFIPTMAISQPASAMMSAFFEREAGQGERLSGIDLSKGLLDGSGIITQKRGASDVPVRASPPPTTYVTNQISAAITPLKPGTTEIALSPAELGSVRITVAAHEQGVQIMIAAERPETAELLRRNLDLLSQDLRQSVNGEVSFSFAHGEGGGTDAKSHAASPAARAMPEGEMQPQLAPSRHLLSANLDLRL